LSTLFLNYFFIHLAFKNNYLVILFFSGLFLLEILLYIPPNFDFENSYQKTNMLNEFDIFKDFLKQHHLRWTPQRKLVLEEFLACEGHVHIDEMHERVRGKDPTIGIATLYRTMKLLVDSGLANMHSFNDKTTYERLFQVRHHDHLICKGCGKTIEFEHPLIEKYQLEICDRHGFTLKSHRMELFGICKDCRK